MFNQEEINKMVQNHLKSDEINEFVNNKVKETVKKAIDDQFSPWSKNDNKNAAYITINKAVSEAVGLNLKNIKIPEFQASFIHLLNESLNKVAGAEMSKIMKENMEKLLITDKKSITLQEFIYEYLDSVDKLDELQEIMSDYYCECDARKLSSKDIDIEFILEHDEIMGLKLANDEQYSRHIYVCFQKKGNEEYTFSYQNNMALSQDDKEKPLYRAYSFSSKDFDKNTNMITKKITNFDRLLFQIAQGIVQLEITEDEINNYFEKRD